MYAGACRGDIGQGHAGWACRGQGQRVGVGGQPYRHEQARRGRGGAVWGVRGCVGPHEWGAFPFSSSARTRSSSRPSSCQSTGPCPADTTRQGDCRCRVGLSRVRASWGQAQLGLGLGLCPAMAGWQQGHRPGCKQAWPRMPPDCPLHVSIVSLIPMPRSPLQASSPSLAPLGSSSIAIRAASP